MENISPYGQSFEREETPLKKVQRLFLEAPWNYGEIASELETRIIEYCGEDPRNGSQAARFLFSYDLVSHLNALMDSSVSCNGKEDMRELHQVLSAVGVRQLLAQLECMLQMGLGKPRLIILESKEQQQ